MSTPRLVQQHKRTADSNSTPAREGIARGDKHQVIDIASLVSAASSAVPALPLLATAAAAPPVAPVAPAAAASAAESSTSVSMANIEHMFSRLLEHTKTQICSETANTIATHVAGLQSDVASVRADLDVEREARQVTEAQNNARFAALEQAVSASARGRTQTSGPSRTPFDDSEPLCVVGRVAKDKLTKAQFVELVEQAFTDVDGFQHVCVERMSNVPRIALVKFDSLEKRDEFVRVQASIHEMDGFWASKNRSLEDRLKDKALFKIKRAICEISGCDGATIVIDKPSKTVYRIGPDGSLTEVANAPSNSSINWHAQVEQPIRDRAQQLLASE